MDKQNEKTKPAFAVKSAMVALIAGCTVCCAPLIVSIIAGLFGALGLGADANALMSGKGLALIALVGGSIGLLYWRLKSKPRLCELDGRACECTSKYPT